MDVVFDGAGQVKVDHEANLLHICEVPTKYIVNDENLLVRQSRPSGTGRAELGKYLLASRRTKLLMEGERFDGASSELILNCLDVIHRRCEDDGMIEGMVLAQISESLEFPFASVRSFKAASTNHFGTFRCSANGEVQVVLLQTSHTWAGTVSPIVPPDENSYRFFQLERRSEVKHVLRNRTTENGNLAIDATLSG